MRVVTSRQHCLSCGSHHVQWLLAPPTIIKRVLPNGKHANMAAEGVSIMGPNLRKMCLVMSDAAALDVARMMYDSKDELVRDLTGVAWSQVHLILLTFFGLPFFTVPFPPSPSPRRDPGRQRDKRDELRSPVHKPRRG